MSSPTPTSPLSSPASSPLNKLSQLPSLKIEIPEVLSWGFVKEMIDLNHVPNLLSIICTVLDAPTKFQHPQIIELLGLNHGVRSISPIACYYPQLLHDMCPEMLDLVRIIRSKPSWLIQPTSTTILLDNDDDDDIDGLFIQETGGLIHDNNTKGIELDSDIDRSTPSVHESKAISSTPSNPMSEFTNTSIPSKSKPSHFFMKMYKESPFHHFKSSLALNFPHYLFPTTHYQSILSAYVLNLMFNPLLSKDHVNLWLFGPHENKNFDLHLIFDRFTLSTTMPFLTCHDYFYWCKTLIKTRLNSIAFGSSNMPLFESFFSPFSTITTTSNNITTHLVNYNHTLSSQITPIDSIDINNHDSLTINQSIKLKPQQSISPIAFTPSISHPQLELPKREQHPLYCHYLRREWINGQVFVQELYKALNYNSTIHSLQTALLYFTIQYSVLLQQKDLQSVYLTLFQEYNKNINVFRTIELFLTLEKQSENTKNDKNGKNDKNDKNTNSALPDQDGSNLTPSSSTLTNTLTRPMLYDPSTIPTQHYGHNPIIPTTIEEYEAIIGRIKTSLFYYTSYSKNSFQLFSYLFTTFHVAMYTPITISLMYITLNVYLTDLYTHFHNLSQIEKQLRHEYQLESLSTLELIPESNPTHDFARAAKNIIGGNINNDEIQRNFPNQEHFLSTFPFLSDQNSYINNILSYQGVCSLTGINTSINMALVQSQNSYNGPTLSNQTTTTTPTTVSILSNSKPSTSKPTKYTQIDTTCSNFDILWGFKLQQLFHDITGISFMTMLKYTPEMRRSAYDKFMSDWSKNNTQNDTNQVDLILTRVLSNDTDGKNDTTINISRRNTNMLVPPAVTTLINSTVPLHGLSSIPKYPFQEALWHTGLGFKDVPYQPEQILRELLQDYVYSGSNSNFQLNQSILLLCGQNQFPDTSLKLYQDKFSSIMKKHQRVIARCQELGKPIPDINQKMKTPNMIEFLHCPRKALRLMSTEYFASFNDWLREEWADDEDDDDGDVIDEIISNQQQRDQADNTIDDSVAPTQNDEFDDDDDDDMPPAELVDDSTSSSLPSLPSAVNNSTNSNNPTQPQSTDTEKRVRRRKFVSGRPERRLLLKNAVPQLTKVKETIAPTKETALMRQLRKEKDLYLKMDQVQDVIPSEFDNIWDTYDDNNLHNILDDQNVAKGDESKVSKKFTADGGLKAVNDGDKMKKLALMSKMKNSKSNTDDEVKKVTDIVQNDQSKSNNDTKVDKNEQIDANTTETKSTKAKFLLMKRLAARKKGGDTGVDDSDNGPVKLKTPESTNTPIPHQVSPKNVTRQYDDSLLSESPNLDKKSLNFPYSKLQCNFSSRRSVFILDRIHTGYHHDSINYEPYITSNNDVATRSGLGDENGLSKNKFKGVNFFEQHPPTFEITLDARLEMILIPLQAYLWFWVLFQDTFDTDNDLSVTNDNPQDLTHECEVMLSHIFHNTINNRSQFPHQITKTVKLPRYKLNEIVKPELMVNPISNYNWLSLLLKAKNIPYHHIQWILGQDLRIVAVLAGFNGGIPKFANQVVNDSHMKKIIAHNNDINNNGPNAVLDQCVELHAGSNILFTDHTFTPYITHLISVWTGIIEAWLINGGGGALNQNLLFFQLLKYFFESLALIFSKPLRVRPINNDSTPNNSPVSTGNTTATTTTTTTTNNNNNASLDNNQNVKSTNTNTNNQSYFGLAFRSHRVIISIDSLLSFVHQTFSTIVKFHPAITHQPYHQSLLPTDITDNIADPNDITSYPPNSTTNTTASTITSNIISVLTANTIAITQTLITHSHIPQLFIANPKRTLKAYTSNPTLPTDEFPLESIIQPNLSPIFDFLTMIAPDMTVNIPWNVTIREEKAVKYPVTLFTPQDLFQYYNILGTNSTNDDRSNAYCNVIGTLIEYFLFPTLETAMFKHLVQYCIRCDKTTNKNNNNTNNNNNGDQGNNNGGSGVQIINDERSVNNGQQVLVRHHYHLNIKIYNVIMIEFITKFASICHNGLSIRKAKHDKEFGVDERGDLNQNEIDGDDGNDNNNNGIIVDGVNTKKKLNIPVVVPVDRIIAIFVVWHRYRHTSAPLMLNTMVVEKLIEITFGGREQIPPYNMPITTISNPNNTLNNIKGNNMNKDGLNKHELMKNLINVNAMMNENDNSSVNSNESDSVSSSIFSFMNIAVPIISLVGALYWWKSSQTDDVEWIEPPKEKQPPRRR